MRPPPLLGSSRDLERFQMGKESFGNIQEEKREKLDIIIELEKQKETTTLSP